MDCACLHCLTSGFRGGAVLLHLSREHRRILCEESVLEDCACDLPNGNLKEDLFQWHIVEMSNDCGFYRLGFINKLTRQNFSVLWICLLEMFQIGLRAVTLRAFG